MNPYRTPAGPPSEDTVIETIAVSTFDWSRVDPLLPPGESGHSVREWRVVKRYTICGAARAVKGEHAGAGPWTEPSRPPVRSRGGT